LFAGFYYWWPKVFGKTLSERLGKWNFWLMVIGMNMTFGPMHIMGLQGQPRRMVIWTEFRSGDGFFNLAFWNRVSSVGAFILAVGIFIFIINVIKTTRSKVLAPGDPWDARSLEWMTNSPPKEHNFDAIPNVTALDEFFHRKYAEDLDTEQLTQVATYEDVMKEQEEHAEKHFHMPSPSYWPLVLALGLPIIAYGIIFSRILAVFGGVIVLLGSFGWALEPSVAPDEDYDPPADGGEASKELVTLG